MSSENSTASPSPGSPGGPSNAGSGSVIRRSFTRSARRLSVMFTKKDTQPHILVRAVRSYAAQHESELSFQVGDEIAQLDESSGWLEGELNGRRGWFPIECVEVVRGPALHHPTTTPEGNGVASSPKLPTAEDTGLVEHVPSRSKTSERLEAFLKQRRPQREELENRNILPAGTAVGTSCSPQVVETQKKLEKTKKAQVLSTFLKGKGGRGTVILPARGRKREGTKSGKALFGTEIFASTDDQPWEIPAVVTSCVNYLETGLDTHGLFRLSGNQLDINKWKEALNASGGYVDFIKEKVDIHVVACILKEYIRSLAEPPVPFVLYEPLMECLDLPCGRSDALATLLVEGLPEPNRIFLNYMLVFLKKVSMHSDVNMMTSANLGIIFGPAFIQPKTTTVEKMMSPKPVEAVAMLIDQGGIDTH